VDRNVRTQNVSLSEKHIKLVSIEYKYPDLRFCSCNIHANRQNLFK